MNLYQISNETEVKLTQLGEMLENGETPSQAFIDECLELQNNLCEKLVNYGKFLKNTQSDIDGLDAEIKRLTAKKKVLVSRAEIIKNSMQAAMIANDIEKIDDPIMPVRLQLSPPSIRIDIDVVQLPQEYQKIKVEADRTALSKALKAGAEINGVVLEQKQHIRIG